MASCHLGQKGKLSTRYIRPFEIRSRVRDLAYILTLLPDPAVAHNVFNVSMLRRYVSNQSHVIEYEPLDIQPDVTYDEKLLGVVDVKE